MNTEWIICPICHCKTRLKIRNDTELKNFPLYCPKCKRETLINVQQMNNQLSKSQTHRRRADNAQIKNAVIGFSFLGTIISRRFDRITEVLQKPLFIIRRYREVSSCYLSIGKIRQTIFCQKNPVHRNGTFCLCI